MWLYTPIYSSLFLLLFSAAISAQNNTKIIDTTITKHPYMVTLVDSTKTTTHMYHGVLIALDWVLTTSTNVLAISKAPDYNLDQIEAGIESKPSAVTNTTDTKDTGRKIERSFHFNDSWTKGDIGMIKVAQPFTQSTTIKPIALPKGPFTGDFRCDKAKVVGFGLEAEKSDASKLQELPVELLNLTQCGRTSPLLPDITTICVNEQLCDKDKGQVLICENGQEQVLLGFLMASPDTSSDCQQPYPATNVSSYMTWIHKISRIPVAFRSRPHVEDPSILERNVKLFSSAGSWKNADFRVLVVLMVFGNMLGAA